jgi:hypothetical protein
MINFMVANMRKGSKYSEERLLTALKAQIENSLDLGWRREDIVILANFDFEFMDVRTLKSDRMNEFCLTGSKCFGVLWYLTTIQTNGVVWAHDLDAWQNAWFDPPAFRDAGVTHYSRPKINGGSIFWRKSGTDLLQEVVDLIVEEQRDREEPALDQTLRGREDDRVTVLDNTYNVGCSGFVPRFENAMRPVRVCHFHPDNRIAWETHALDRNGLDDGPLTPRLERLLRRYYPHLATELSPEGQKKANKLREKRREGE